MPDYNNLQIGHTTWYLHPFSIVFLVVLLWHPGIFLLLGGAPPGLDSPPGQPGAATSS